LYGRAHAPRYRVDCNSTGINCSNAADPALIYYEFYSTDADVPLRRVYAADAQRSTDGLRWFRNGAHSIANSDGNTTSSVQQYGSLVTSSLSPAGATTNAVYTYTGINGYPYKATMSIGTDLWLVYSRFNSAAIINEFEIEFNRESGNAGGSGTGNTQGNSTNTNTARRIRW